MRNIQATLEKEEARIREVLVTKPLSKYDKELLIERRKKVEDRLKYFLLGKKEKNKISDAKIRMMRGEVNTYKENYKLIWGKLEEVENMKKRCFCGGDKLWRPICSECQKFRDDTIFPIMREWILTNQKKKSMEDFFFFVGKDLEKDLDKVGYDVKNCSQNVQEASK